MLLRTKVFMAIAGIGLVLSTLFFYVWIPSADKNSRNILDAHTHSRLNIASEVLIPLLIQQQYADIYESLDVLLETNSDWMAIVLYDGEDSLIYPLSLPETGSNDQYLTFTHDINLRGKRLGKLVLTSDIRDELATLRDQNHRLFQLFLGGLFLGLLAIMILLDRFVSRPAKNLAFAAEQLAKGDYAASLPPTSRDEIGNLTNSFVAMRDAIQTNETELRVLSQAVEQAPISIVITNRGGVIEYVNPSFTRVTGFTPEDAIGNTPRILKSGKHPLKFYENLWSTITSGKVWAGEMQNRSKGGNTFWESVAIAPIFDTDGEIIHFVGAKEEITQRKAMEASLREAKKVADKANQAKSEFLSSMSHELRTPMNAILGFGQMLEFNPKVPLTEEQKDCVDHILRSSHHLLELINQVLDLATIESNKLTISLEPIQVDEVCQDCLALIDAQAKRRDITTDGDLCSNSVIKADFTRFKQVLLNLLSNAVKYNREGGQISLTCKDMPNGMVRISVTDTGDGIPKDNQTKLFEPFNRLGKEASEIEGTGIGLTITKELTEIMGGTIGFKSDVGKGSTFWVEFVKVKNIEAEIIKMEDALEERNQQSEASASASILYIEDNPGNLRLMEAVIAKMDGPALISAHTAELGLALAEENLPDLILMDINLPGMSGIEALKKLQEVEGTKNIPVVAITAAAMPKDVEAGVKAGFSDYITKPINLIEITEKIEAILSTD